MMAVLALDLSLDKKSLNGKKGLIIYSGQSRFFDKSIELQIKAIENFKRLCGLNDKDFKLDIMLSTWKEDTPQYHTDSLNKWTHGEVFSRLIEENTAFDELKQYNPDIINSNNFRAIIGKIHALCHIYDIPSHYDFFILTRTDYHVPCIDFEDAKFYNGMIINASYNMTTVLDAFYTYKSNCNGWNTLIDDNYSVISPNLVYILDKNRMKDMVSSIIHYAYEEKIFSIHALMLQFLCKLHIECDRYYDETDTVMRNSFRNETRIGFFKYPKSTKLMRTEELIDALLLDYSIEKWNALRKTVFTAPNDINC